MGGGGGGGNGLLNMGLMVAAGIAAPELAAEFAPEMMAAGGASGAAVGAATGAGLSGLTAAATGQNVLKSALIGGVGGALTGYAPDVSGAANGAASGATNVSGQIGQSIQAMEQAGASSEQIAQSLMDNYGMTGAQAAQTMGQVAATGSTVGGIGMQGANLVDQTAGISSNIGLPQTPYGTAAPTVNPTPNMFGQVAGPTNSQLYTSAGINTLGGLSKKPVGAYTPPNAIDTGGSLSKFKYDPNNYTPDTVVPPKPPYQANYSGMAAAKGGIMSLASGGTGKDALKDLLSSRDAMDQYESQYQSDPTAVAGKAQGGDYNAMLVLNKQRGTPNANYARGGKTYNLGDYSDGGRLLKGPGDGMSDDIPATIGHKQEARLADGEFVVPADVVSGLGNGSTDAGAKHLYKMMDKVRHARTGRKSQAKQIKGEKFVPA